MKHNTADELQDSERKRLQRGLEVELPGAVCEANGRAACVEQTSAVALQAQAEDLGDAESAEPYCARTKSNNAAAV